jgi:hypothetical protein
VGICAGTSRSDKKTREAAEQDSHKQPENWLMVSWRAGGANTTDPVAKVWDLLYRAGIEGRLLNGGSGMN